MEVSKRIELIKHPDGHRGAKSVYFMENTGWGKKQKLLTTLNVAAMVIIALGILVGINYLSSRRHFRVDCTFKQEHALSAKTKNVLNNLKEPVKIYTVFDDSPYRTVSVAEIQRKLADLLEEYKIYGKDKIIVEEIKAAQSPEEFELLKRKLKVETVAPNDMVLVCGERQKNVNLIETYEREYGQWGQEAGIKSFKGEEAVTSAILNVTQVQKVVIYFMTGQDEPDIDSGEQEDCAMINAYIKRENIETKKIRLLEEHQIPADCGALIVAGPRKPFSAPELQIINKYLKNGGNLIVLLDPMTETGIENTLKEWGVKLDDGIIIDPKNCMPFLGNPEPMAVVLSSYGSHKITEKMKDAETIFVFGRPVELAAGAAGTELVKTESSAWLETNIEELTKKHTAKFNADKDRKGPISLAVAITKKVQIDNAAPATPTATAEKEAKLVVIGDSDHLKNKFTSSTLGGGMPNPLFLGGRVDLFMNTVRWMTGQEVLLSIEPKKPEDKHIDLTPTRISFLFWFSIIIIPALGGLLGVFMWIMRRK
ncbi:MAG: GldG family protein [Planctomycetes bacterium]|nr:GldG family protein [Planctomycetota bacterium]